MWQRNEDTDTEEVDRHAKKNTQTDTNTHVLRCWKCLMERQRCTAEAWRAQSRTERHTGHIHVHFLRVNKHLYWVCEAMARWLVCVCVWVGGAGSWGMQAAVVGAHGHPLLPICSPSEAEASETAMRSWTATSHNEAITSSRSCVCALNFSK